MARGTVQRYKTGWSIRYDAGIDEQTGRRRQPFESGFATRQEAETRLAACLHEVATGRYVKPTAQTFGEFARYWYGTISVRPSTRVAYDGALRLHLLPAFEQLAMQAIKPSTVKRFYQDCAAKDLAANTIGGIHGVLRQIFKVAVEEEVVLASVMDKVRRPSVERREMAFWSPADAARFLALTHGSRFAMLWHIYVMTGMRCAEALGLRWSDVDWEHRLLHVRQQVLRGKGRLGFGPPKNELGRRSVLVSAATMERLRAHRTRQTAIRLASRLPWEHHDLVFAREPLRVRVHGLGAPWGPDTISQYFRTEITALDLPTIRLHDVRHTHATILLAEDGNIKAIAARLGHDPAVLLRTYAHVLPEHQERAVARFEAALAGAAHPAASGR